ncbi:hypothetical protein CAAN1_03S04720 [[Candida] anglica]|uniref:Uncharacterized protein n=1 Tax=[Candida] anglica TaxID=148631 RepID=A0ABP0EH20_9ASCO
MSTLQFTTPTMGYQELRAIKELDHLDEKSIAFNNNSDEIPRRSPARLINREAMVFKEKLVAAAANASVVAAAEFTSQYYSDASDADDSFNFSDDQSSSGNSVFSGASSPVLDNNSAADSLDEEFFNEIDEACVCVIDDVIQVKSVHDNSSRTRRPLSYITLSD